jgi:hypothetical protein
MEIEVGREAKKGRPNNDDSVSTTNAVELANQY